MYLFSVSMGIAAINDAIDADDAEALMTGLTLPDVALHGVLPDCRHSYLEKLHDLKVGRSLVKTKYSPNRT